MIKVKIHVDSQYEDLMTSLLYQYQCQGIEVISHKTLTERTPDLYGEIYTLNPDDYPTEGSVILAYYPDQDEDQLFKDIEGTISSHSIPLYRPIEISQFTPIDYMKQYQESVEEIRIGQLSIIPPWQENRELGRDYIHIEPGTGFGTGTHETTRLCLRLMEKWIKPHDDIIDVGTGSGILALRAGMLSEGKIVAVEVDPLALKNAERNAKLNGQAILFYNSLKDVQLTCNFLIANIVLSILIELFPQFKERLKPGGRILLSGLLREEEPLIERIFKQEGFIIDEKQVGESFLAYVVRVKD